MMRSLSSGVAGLRSHQTRMDVIGNNIANVNTYGFKSSRVTFADVYYQNINGASSGNATQGGKNPTQIGYGSSVATIDMLNNISGSGTTDRALDVYIGGDGFLICKDSSGKALYTRLGNLGFDSAGNLVDGNGSLVQGFPKNPDGTIKISADGSLDPSELTTIQCDPEILNKLTGISISNTGEINGVLPGAKILQAANKSAQYVNLDTLSIPGESNYSGKVTLKVGAIPDAGIVGGTDLVTKKTAVLGTGSYVTTDTPPVTFTVKSATHAAGAEFKTLADGATYSLSFDGTDYTLNMTEGGTRTQYPGTIDGNGVLTFSSVMTLTLNPAPGAAFSDFDISGKMVSKTYQEAGTTPTDIKITSFDYGNIGLPDDANYEMTFDGKKTFTLKVTGSLSQPSSNVTYTGVIDADGKVTFKNSGTGNTALVMMVDTSTPLPTSPSTFPLTGTGTLKYQVQTNDDGGNVVKLPPEPQDMPSSGALQGLDGIYIELNDKTQEPFVGDVGTAMNDEDILYTIGNIAVAMFGNSSGMKSNGSGYFTETPNSGGVQISRPGLRGTGEVAAGYLELSNVDVSKEFTDMITTQRGFQANSRIITVSDTMLEELVNLKR